MFCRPNHTAFRTLALRSVSTFIEKYLVELACSTKGEEKILNPHFFFLEILVGGDFPGGGERTGAGTRNAREAQGYLFRYGFLRFKRPIVSGLSSALFRNFIGDEDHLAVHTFVHTN